MGMVACFAAVAPDVLDRLISDEDSIPDYLQPEDGDGPPNSIDIDKSWHGIHYLLTGQADGGDGPEALAVLGGEEFGPEVGYGPARFLPPADVAAVAQALARVSPETLAGRYNPRDMDAKDIYPAGIWVRDGAEGLDYALEYYRELAAFYQAAAARGDAVILWMS